MKKKVLLLFCVMLMLVGITACSGKESANRENDVIEKSQQNDGTDGSDNSTDEVGESVLDVTIQFGNDGEKFLMKMEDNETANALVKNIGEEGKNLPIYDYDNFEGWEYFQYYDIPTSYDIPENPSPVTSVKAGEIYYSEPNRIMLFYQDAEISGEYTKVGVIEDTDGLKKAVEDNPVLEGWGNKLVLLRYAK